MTPDDRAPLDPDEPTPPADAGEPDGPTERDGPIEPEDAIDPIDQGDPDDAPTPPDPFAGRMPPPIGPGARSRRTPMPPDPMAMMRPPVPPVPPIDDDPGLDADMPDPDEPAEPGTDAPPPTMAQAAGEAVMTLVDHLAELRNRIVWSVLAILGGAIIGFAAGDRIIEFLRDPLPITDPLRFSGIGDPFAIRIRIALIVGIILAMPILLWHVWRFIAPGLTDEERKAIRPWIPAALVFFILGVSIAYIVLPFAATFLLSFATDDLQPLLTAREYFDFVSTLFLAFGLLMEFPILLVGLSRVGIVTSERLSRSRRVAVLAIAVFAAAATPGGDLVSPAILGLTLYALYEGTIIVVRRSGR